MALSLSLVGQSNCANMLRWTNEYNWAHDVIKNLIINLNIANAIYSINYNCDGMISTEKPREIALRINACECASACVCVANDNRTFEILWSEIWLKFISVAAKTSRIITTILQFVQMNVSTNLNPFLILVFVFFWWTKCNRFYMLDGNMIIIGSHDTFHCIFQLCDWHSCGYFSVVFFFISETEIKKNPVNEFRLFQKSIVNQSRLNCALIYVTRFAWTQKLTGIKFVDSKHLLRNHFSLVFFFLLHLVFSIRFENMYFDLDIVSVGILCKS